MIINETEFFRDILKTNSSPKGECIEWTGRLNPGGYGYIYAYKRSWTAHRVAFLVHNGHLPDDLYICHKCNNRKCINPQHLYAGTAKDNARDFKNAPYYAEKMEEARKRADEHKKFAEKFHKDYFLISMDQLKFLTQEIKSFNFRLSWLEENYKNLKNDS